MQCCIGGWLRADGVHHRQVSRDDLQPGVDHRLDHWHFRHLGALEFVAATVYFRHRVRHLRGQLGGHVAGHRAGGDGEVEVGGFEYGAGLDRHGSRDRQRGIGTAE